MLKLKSFKIRVPPFLINIGYFSVLFLLLLRLLGSFIDPDLWWHIRLGENIVNNNWVNNLTFTCTDYIWVNHSWLSDVLIGQLHKFAGFQGLSIFFGIIYLGGIVCNFLFVKEILKSLNIKLSKTLGLLYITLFIVVLSSFIAARPQAFSFLFINLFLFLLIKISAAKSIKYLNLVYFAPLCLLWVNLHGGFPVGIILIAVFFVYHSWQLIQSTLLNEGKLKVIQQLKVIAFFASFLLMFSLISFLNPFGIRIWDEIFALVLGASNANFIAEWKSINIKDLYFLSYFLLCAAALILQIFNKSYNLLRLLLLLVFGFISFYSIRYILPASGLVLAVFIIELVRFINRYKDLFKDKESIRALKLLEILFWFVFAVFGLLCVSISFKFVSNLTDLDNGDNPTLAMYPVEAVEFIENHQETFKEVNFYNTYVWGGYLSYRLPGYNWFINGIMPEWNCKGNVKNTVMLDYVELENLGSKWPEVLKNYNIGAVLIQNGSTLSNVLNYNPDWKILYQDDLSVLYYKNSD